MKSPFFNTFAFGLLVILIACTKEPSAEDNFNDNYAGTYNCVSAVFAPDPDYLADPIDFIGNGDKTKDIFEGLNISLEDSRKMTAYIPEITNISMSGFEKLTLWVPLQNIDQYNQRESGYPVRLIVPNYIMCPISFIYRVDKNGDMQIYNDGDLSGMLYYYNNYMDFTSNPQILNCENARIVSLGQGEIMLMVSLCYIDFTDDRWLKSDCFFKYVRL